MNKNTCCSIKDIKKVAIKKPIFNLKKVIKK